MRPKELKDPTTMLLSWVRWEGQKAAGLCLSSMMELSTCSCLYPNMDEHNTNINGVWWPACKPRAGTDPPGATEPWWELTTGASSFSCNLTKTIHDCSKQNCKFWVTRAWHNPFPPCKATAPQLTPLMSTHSCTWDTCKHASSIRSQLCPTGMATGMGTGVGTWMGTGMGTAPTCCNSLLQPV